MNFYNKYVFCTLLYSLPFCIYSMEKNTIKKFVSGAIVREINYSDEQLKHLKNIDLNSSLINDDYTTEDESETTETVEILLTPENQHSVSIIAQWSNHLDVHPKFAHLIKITQKEYLNSFNKNNKFNQLIEIANFELKNTITQQDFAKDKSKAKIEHTQKLEEKNIQQLMQNASMYNQSLKSKRTEDKNIYSLFEEAKKAPKRVPVAISKDPVAIYYKRISCSKNTFEAKNANYTKKRRRT